jgi:hypothetical protein
VVINEWMADNRISIADPADDDFEDWFELYNSGLTPADLSGFYLGQSLTNRTEFRIPAGYIIPPHGFLLVWADDETGQNSSNRVDLHTNFKLSKNGDGIGLFAPDPDGTVIDFVSFGAQTTDVSQGRFPDGWPSISTLDTPTPRGTNFLLLPNTSPMISPIPPQTIFEGQLVTFSIPALDGDVPAQRLSFSLGGGAPSGAALNPDTGLFSWKPGSDLASTTNLFTVSVTDDGVPPLSASTSFEIRVMRRPQIDSVRPIEPGGLMISFVTVPGKTYRLEYKNELTELDWIPLSAWTYCEGENMQIEDENAVASQRFYRVAVQ